MRELMSPDIRLLAGSVIILMYDARSAASRVAALVESVPEGFVNASTPLRPSIVDDVWVIAGARVE